LDRYIDKKEMFPELEVFETALLSMDDYFRRRETEIRLSDKSNDQKKKELEDLKKRKEKANKIRNSITSAMREYEAAVRDSNAYESKKLRLLVEAMQDKKVIKTFTKERELINKRKINAKENLIKALQSQELGWINTTYIASKSLEKDGYDMIEVEKAYGGRSLKDVMSKTNLDPRVVASQFVTNTEYQGIQSKNPEVNVSTNINEISDFSNFTSISTNGQGLYVEDRALKSMIDESSLEEKDKEIKKEEALAVVEPTIPQIDIIIKAKKGLSSGEIRTLKVTKEKYQELGLLDLEYDRVNTVLQMLDKNPAYAKTCELLKAYEVKLLKQRKDRISKVMELTEEAKVNEFSSQVDRQERMETAEKGMRYWEQVLSMNPNDEYAKQKVEEFREILFNGGYEEEPVSKTI